MPPTGDLGASANHRHGFGIRHSALSFQSAILVPTSTSAPVLAPMTYLTIDHAHALLADLVAMDSINPMGGPWTRLSPVEHNVADYLSNLFRHPSVEVVSQPVSERHENLVVTARGRTDAPALLFESHMDTVPADDWADRALVPRVEGSILYGRGACDDKGPLVAMVLALLELLESGPPEKTVIFVAAGDEEYAQTGIRHYMMQAGQPFQFGVFGEPTRNVPVVQHKGVVRWDITTIGVSAHTSQPDLGRCAILQMMRVIEAIGRYQEIAGKRHPNPMMTGPRITVSRIDGGRTRNAVADRCTAWIDYRIMPDLDPMGQRTALIEYLAALDVEIEHAEPQVTVPPLNTSVDDPFVDQVLDACAAVSGRQIKPTGAPYGTDASWLPPGVPAVVIGPGAIDHAHAIDEHVDLEEVVQCAEIHLRLMRGA